MKFAVLKASVLFLSGFGVGVVLFYLRSRREIVEFIENYRERELHNKKRRSELQTESSLLDDLEIEQQSLTFERFFHHLGGSNDSLTDHNPPERVEERGEACDEFHSTGETIRQYLDTEYGDPISFQYFDSFQTLWNENSLEFCSEYVSCYSNLTENPASRYKSNFSSAQYLPDQTKTVPIFSTAMKNKLKIHQPEPSRTPPVLEHSDFKAFAKNRLKMPATVFLTPYPLHIMYRKLRTLASHTGRTDFGFYHTLILPEQPRQINPCVSIYHTFRNSLQNEKYGPDLDLKSIHPNDYQLDSKLSLQFREFLLKLIDELVSEESWIECYHCPPRQTEQVSRYILDLPQYNLFIQPLHFNINSKISNFLSEYYKIVQKPF